VNAAQLSRGGLFAYAAFALPLAMAALPIYVHVPKYYAGTLGVPLAWVGAILLATRLFDALQDPLLGYLSDRSVQTRLGRRLPVLLGVPVLAVGFVALFNVPDASVAWLALWLAGCLVVVTLGFSAASISYFAMGAELSRDYHERTRVTATRGALGVLGVLIAAALPVVLSAEAGDESGLAAFSLLFLPVIALCTLATLVWSPKPPRQLKAPRFSWRRVLQPLANREFRWLMAVFVASGIAAAIPGTLILFFVQDVLQRPQYAGLFLGIYFLFGAIGMPAWIGASRRLGKRNAWLVGMFLAVAAFIWAFSLGEGEVIGFALVCMLSGLAYGAELAIPSSMLADVVDGGLREGEARPDGAYFGLWQMLEKLNLALAAGIALPALAWLGYAPGTPQASFGALSAMYALVPCAIKLASAALLWWAPLDRRTTTTSVYA
jgi:glycoside/pentoside/hexuronide:cation symporter, GPH family